jgi:hypothetical protein
LNKEGNITTLNPTPESTVKITPRVKSKKQHTAHKKDQVHSKWFAKWEQHRHAKCKICEKEGTDNNNKLLGCAYCEHRSHDKCDIRQLNCGRKEWNTYQCVECVETFKHPTVREEERVRKIAQAMETLDEYNKSHDNYCCRCQKTVEETDNGDESKYVLSCASCMKSAHEYGCATQEETVIGQYWQCKECRSRRQDILGL